MVGSSGFSSIARSRCLVASSKLPSAEMRPAERVDDIAVVRPLLDRAADHLHAVVEIDALIDPGIAEIVQDMRLVGEQLERLLEIGFGVGPVLGALVADAAEIEDQPIGFFRIGDGRDALAVGVRAFGILLAGALDIAERHDRFEVFRRVRRSACRAALSASSVRSTVSRLIASWISALRRSGEDGRNLLVDLDRELGLLQRFIKVGEREQRERVLRREIKRELQIDEAEILAAAPSERRAEAVKRFGRAGLRIVDQRRQFLAGADFFHFAGDQRMARQRLVEGFENLERFVLLALRERARSNRIRTTRSAPLSSL